MRSSCTIICLFLVANGYLFVSELWLPQHFVEVMVTAGRDSILLCLRQFDFCFIIRFYLRLVTFFLYR